MNTIVERDHPEPNVNLTYIQQTGQTNTLTDGGDIYTGLDRFGRVIDQNWWNPSTISSTDRFQYGFDRASEVLYKNNLVAPAQSELYHASSTASGDNNTAYDLVGRLTGFARGTLSASGNNGSVMDTVASSSRSQSWSLDALGNWSSQTTNGSTTTRGFNAQNETTSVSTGTAPRYDSNGNTASDAGQTMVFDAWNRLVGVKSGSVLVAAYPYDALTRRISETYSSSATTNHLYYSPQWQVIEERVNGTTASNVTFQYVWGAAYLDQMVLRDSYSGGSRTLRLYVQQDANFNVTALVSVSGAVQERYLYDPYGSATITDASYTARSSSSYGWIYLHQGGRQDAVTGWYLFRFRDYIPGEGRWAERDPLGYGAGDTNLFRFVASCPIERQDPLGLDDEKTFAAIAKLLGLDVGTAWPGMLGTPCDVALYDADDAGDQRGAAGGKDFTKAAMQHAYRYSTTRDACSGKAEDYSLTKILDELKQWVERNRPITSLTIYDHGSPGIQELGDVNIPDSFWLRLRPLMGPNACLALKGCSVGADEEFCQKVANLTGCCVTASPGLTYYGRLPWYLFEPFSWHSLPPKKYFPDRPVAGTTQCD